MAKVSLSPLGACSSVCERACVCRAPRCHIRENAVVAAAAASFANGREGIRCRTAWVGDYYAVIRSSRAAREDGSK